MTVVAIVDYGLCNLDSVRRAVEECGATALVTAQYPDLERADRIILPGVGAFRDAMLNLEKAGLVEAMTEQVLGRNVPFLGICLGMQLTASRSWEGGDETPGLDWIKGEVRRLEASTDARVPHVGWNEVLVERESHLFRDVARNGDFYFVHSYAVHPRLDDTVVARTPYGQGHFVSAVERGPVFGVQFHPEKSQRLGFQVLRNFLAL